MRLQLALNVSDIDTAVDFYSKMFGTEPAKRKPGYANYEIAQPPLKLVLIENSDGGGTLNHLGVETETPDEVVDAEGRLGAAGLAPTEIEDTTCCYAEKTETWVHDPDGAPWEWYVKTADANQFSNSIRVADTASGCGCGSIEDEAPAHTAGACCGGAPEATASVSACC